MKIYLVGGAVRDGLLHIQPQERDWVVVGGSETEMLAQGFRRADAEFPVFLHPETGEEYALARTEIKSGTGYKGFEVNADRKVTLEQDLIRRDLTINSMAQDEDGSLIDSFSGQNDLNQGVLRHISPAFTEDPLRLLRTARFAARFDFTVGSETQGLMEQMAASGELATLSRERVWKEMAKALAGKAPWRFFEVLKACGALQQLHLPLTDLTDAITPLKRAVAMTADPVVRFTSVMFNATADSAGSEALESSLRLPGDYAKLLDLLVQHAEVLPSVADADSESILKLLTELRAEQQPQRFKQFQQACCSIWPELMDRATPKLTKALTAIGGISVLELQAQGLSGKELGMELKRLRLDAISDSLEG
jgi:tRNA nucleotidyltransferase (CCA-adding enzyme)